ncbi:unnamed protein product [Caenorhabditis angaria]|uniref:Uncharacterized protein n=1 Tax=Caenorhabditis angaria TaxID=860376 RepID=A0A9P1I5T2_9PELO|nr:unnamed protein product [Caenorhabditis angaria]
MAANIERVGFSVNVCNQNYDCYIIFNGPSAWIWFGTDRIESIGIAFYPMFTMLSDRGNTQRELLKSISLRLTKGTKFTQVFISTDIENENPEFWSEFDVKLRAELNQIPTIHL